MPKESPGRIATLDGLRAISIGIVLFAHLVGTRNMPAIHHTEQLGEIGVRTFFVISGFLITTLLLREREKTQRVDLKAFYVRRVFRILPAFYTYIAVIAVLTMLGWIVVSRTDFAFAIAYIMNFHAERAWHLGHLWSLAVEEQFYFIWPLAFVLLGTRGARNFAIGAIIAAPILRVAALKLTPQYSDYLDQAFPFVFDSIATGCVLAIIRPDLEANPTYRKLLDAPWFWLVSLGMIATLFITKPMIEMGASTTLGNFGIALAIHRCVTHPDGPVGRVLETSPFIFIGTLSYSLYLWQQPFLDRHDQGWWAMAPVNLGLAVITALASYYLVEKPWLRLGKRFRR
ncbi:MAG: acyltransferase [Kofleriaceae bacterium]